ncbi:hypothetical protein [uncultured Desulfobacter sp.]|uniref:hypothetical protein n=1 Tax=uncultured Desulfobacter sp. TaxID=240139 RepID=UPI00374888F0
MLYPIINLEQSRIGVADFVHGLEEIMMRTARQFGVEARRDPKASMERVKALFFKFFCQIFNFNKKGANP